MSPKLEIYLRELLINHFSFEEIHTLCHDLGVDYDSLGGEGKEAKARELVIYLRRRNRLPELKTEIHRLRPVIGQNEPELPRPERIKEFFNRDYVLASVAIFTLIAIIAIWLSRAFPGLGNSGEPTGTITRNSSVAEEGVEKTAETPASSLILPATTEQPAYIPTLIPTITPTSPLQVIDTRILTLSGGLPVTQVYIPAGSFLMGNDIGDIERLSEGEAPKHEVSLDAFWLDQMEVTNLQFSEFVRDTGYITTAEQRGSGSVVTGKQSESEMVEGANWMHPSGPSSDIDGLDKHPVVLVTWGDADAFCRWRDARLPTEAEWEYAARGTANFQYPWGNEEPTCDRANLGICVGGTAEVGSYLSGASPFGAMDMAGNITEWVYDWFDQSYYENSLTLNPRGPTARVARVLRGGAWDRRGDSVRSARRNKLDPESSSNLIGFRCAQD